VLPPAVAPGANYYLTSDGSGNLSYSAATQIAANISYTSQTYAPTLIPSAGSASIGTQLGNYFQSGNLVFVSVQIGWVQSSANATFVTISLPVSGVANGQIVNFLASANRSGSANLIFAQFLSGTSVNVALLPSTKILGSDSSFSATNSWTISFAFTYMSA